MLELLLFSIAVLNLLLALLFFSKGFKNVTNYIFGIFVLAAAIWPLAIGLFLLSKTSDSACFWDKLIYISGTIVPVSFVFFTNLFTQKKWPKPLISSLFIIFPVGLISLLLFSDLFITNINLIANNKFVHLGIAYIFWVIYFCVYMAEGSLQLFIKYKRSSGRERLQFSYILLALFFPLIGSVPFNIFLPLFGNYQLIYVGPIFLTMMVIIISYAIIRHSLMDIRLIVARSVAYIGLVVILGAFYIGGLFLISTYFIKQETNSTDLAISTILALFMAFTFQPLKGMLEKLTDTIFYHSHYNAEKVLSILSHIMSTNIDLQPLITQTLQAILKEMKITKGALILNSGCDYGEIISEGFSKQLNSLSCHFTSLLDMHRIVIFDNLEEGELKESMRSLDISFAKVLHVNNEIIGFLILGEKASGEIYSDQDLKVFDILSPELSVAIQNAESYDKIKQFNITLGEEVKKATNDLQKANSRLKELDLLKDDFVSVASHELRTPMTAIRSYLWMVLKRPDVKLSEKMESHLSRAYISTERLINLVNDMLNVSRIESGSIEIRPKEFDIQNLVEEIVSMVLPKAGEKNIKIEIIKGKIPTVFADPDKVTQIVLNLLGNALKFTPIDGRVSVNFFTDGKMVDVSIQDSGVGISEDDLSRLFQKFGRLDNSYTAAATSGGTGLGLFISKSLVELMHGKIWAISEGSGKGATFTFSLLILTPQILAESEKYFKKPIGVAKELERVTI